MERTPALVVGQQMQGVMAMSNAYRKFDIDPFLLLCELLSSGDEFFKVVVCSLVVFVDGNGCRVIDLMQRFSFLQFWLVGVRQDALEGTRRIGEVARGDLRCAESLSGQVSGSCRTSRKVADGLAQATD